MGVYSRDDLYTLWMNFRGQSNELQMMQDFGLCSKDEAQKLINEFETRMEVETLDGDHRGKEDRGAVEYGKPTKPTKPKKTAKAAPNPKYQPFRERFHRAVRFIGQRKAAHRRNPEIVTPQNLMYDTFRDAQDTDVVVNAIMAGVNQIVRAIQDSNVEVYVDGDGTATQNRRNRMYGKTLQYI